MIHTITRYIYKVIKSGKTPRILKKNQINLNVAQLNIIENSIRENYHRGWRTETNYTQDAYLLDLNNHLTGRLERNRYLYIPWLNKTVPLNGAHILELGCGTGSSTIALAEQGAHVTGVDIDEDALKVAKDRCSVCNISATLIHGNATQVYNELKDKKFDLIVFFACIEHMLYEERIDCLRKYYDLIPQGKFLSIVETPNRLWYFDDHTSGLPFFNWLNENAAYDYSKYSTRRNFKELYSEPSVENYVHFLRRGRGFSFHELEIALDKPASNLNVVSYLNRPFFPYTLNHKFHKILTRINPDISKGFLNPFIDIIIKK